LTPPYYSRHRKDNNQKQIVADLDAIPSVTYKDVSMVDGFVDLVVGFRGENYLFEIKNPEGRQLLTEHEERFHDYYTGTIHIVTETDQILRIIGAIES
jgi:hypothetical protein